MKKFKYLPSVLMLVLCLAVLAVGVYAIKPTQNTIEGSITINATNAHVVITAYKTSAFNEDGTEATANKLVGPLDARAGAKLQIAEALSFNTETANTKEDVDDVVVVIKIENKSNKALGAYFYEGLSTDTMPEVATLDNVRSSYLFKENESDADEDAIITTSFTGYSYLAPYDNTETNNDIRYMNITFSLNQFKEYTSSFNFPLNIETYNVNLDASTPSIILNTIAGEPYAKEIAVVSNDSTTPTTFNGNISFEEDGMLVGITNIVYTPASEEEPELNAEKFSFNLTYDNEAMGKQNAPAGSVMTEDGPVFLLAGNYLSWDDLLADIYTEEVQPLTLNESFEIDENDESKVIIKQTEATKNYNKFCLYYIHGGDLEISLSTNFETSEKLTIVEGMPQIASYDNMLLCEQTVTQEYTLEAVEGLNKNYSVTNSQLKNIPSDVKAVNITTNVAKGNMYLIDEKSFAALSGEGLSLDGIVERIELGAVSDNKDMFISAGVALDESNTIYEIPTFWSYNGNFNFVTIIKSETEEQKIEVEYSMEFSDEITSSLVCYYTNGSDYIIHGAISNKITEITIPEKIDNVTITNIGSGAFEGSNITKITIPQNITKIGNGAFKNCYYLTEINYNATALETLPLNASVFENAGIYGEGITLNIGANVQNIPNGLFGVYNDYNPDLGLDEHDLAPKIKEVIFEEGSVITSINGNAFNGCESLTSINLPQSLTIIGASAFQNCTGLTNIIIPNNVEEIRGDAFSGCSGLTSLTIPGKVTTIGQWAFSGTGLTEITMLSETPPSLGSGAIPSTTTIYIPNGTLTAYSNATDWTNYVSKLVELNEDGSKPTN